MTSGLIYLLGGLGVLGLFIVIRWLTRKSPLDAASVFLKSRDMHSYRDRDRYFYDDY